MFNIVKKDKVNQTFQKIINEIFYDYHRSPDFFDIPPIFNNYSKDYLKFLSGISKLQCIEMTSPRNKCIIYFYIIPGTIKLEVNSNNQMSLVSCNEQDVIRIPCDLSDFCIWEDENDENIKK